MTHQTKIDTFTSNTSIPPRGSKVTELPGGPAAGIIDKLKYFNTTRRIRAKWQEYWNHHSTVTATKSLLWWRNKIRHTITIRDGCMTLTHEYVALMQEHCRGYWEVYSYDAQDKVVAAFANEADATYFKMLWG